MLRQKFRALRAYVTVTLIIIVSLISSGVAYSSLNLEVKSKEYPDKDTASFPNLLIREVDVPEDLVACVRPNGTAQELAVERLLDAIEERVGRKPRVQSDIPSAGNAVIIGRELASKVAEVPVLEEDEYAIIPFSNDSLRALLVVGGSELAEAHGIFSLADIIEGGSAEFSSLFEVNVTVRPAFWLRLTDTGKTFWDPSRKPSPYDSWHAGFETDEYPFVNETRLEIFFEQLRNFSEKTLWMGFNGIVLGGFLKLINFDYVGTGYEIYPNGSRWRIRHDKMVEWYRKIAGFLKQLGFRVIIGTDFVPLTPPLEEYFRRRFGGIRTDSDEFWDVYIRGMEELFDKLPEVDGIMVRVGEAGGAYGTAEYYSVLAIDTVSEMRKMITKLLPVFERRGKLLIIRTWTIGIGEIGDLHISPEKFREVFSGISSPNLIISTKYCRHDFFYYAPLNPTIGLSNNTHMVEFQIAREYEGFGLYPNFLGELYAEAVKYAYSKGARAAWVWIQSGGWGGPLIIYPVKGFWDVIELNAYVTSKLLWDPESNVTELLQRWIAIRYGYDPGLISNLTKALLLSDDAVRKGIYVGEYARKDVYLNGVLLPTTVLVLWFHVTCSEQSLMLLYETCSDDIYACIAEGFGARGLAERILSYASVLGNRGGEAEALLESFRYLKSLIAVLAEFRRVVFLFIDGYMMLNFTARLALKEAIRDFREALSRYVSRYRNSETFPPYNFTEALEFVRRVEAFSFIWMMAAGIAVAAVLLAALVLLRRPKNQDAICLLAFPLISSLSVLTISSLSDPLLVLTLWFLGQLAVFGALEVVHKLLKGRPGSSRGLVFLAPLVAGESLAVAVLSPVGFLALASTRIGLSVIVFFTVFSYAMAFRATHSPFAELGSRGRAAFLSALLAVASALGIAVLIDATSLIRRVMVAFMLVPVVAISVGVGIGAMLPNLGAVRIALVAVLLISTFTLVATLKGTSWREMTSALRGFIGRAGWEEGAKRHL